MRNNPTLADSLDELTRLRAQNAALTAEVDRLRETNAKALQLIDRLSAQNAALTKYIARSLTIAPTNEMLKDWHAEGVRLLHAMEKPQ